MQLEVRVAPKSIQHEVFGRVAQYKADVASLRHQLSSSSDLREQLFSRQHEEEEDDHYEAGEHDQLLKNTTTLQRASQSLHRAQQVSAQTDEIADNVVLDLGEQRATLLRTRNRVTGIDTEMERTKSLLRTITCRAIENRVILICVIIVELILLAGLTYWKFFS
jgi:vesicle transport through interaction with t-SNAREs protein 1